jgi:surfeit locus 1 family protein
MATKKTPWYNRIWTQSLFIAFISLILIKLGLWQWGRGNLRTQIKQQWESRSQLPAVSLQSVEKMQGGRNYLRIKTSGKFINNKTFLIDNQMLNHQPGYAIITPFKIKSSSKIVLVNRGWIAKQQFNQLNYIQPIQHTALQGLIYQPYKKTFILNSSRFAEFSSPPKVQNSNINAIGKSLGLTSEPYYIWMSTQPNPYHRTWNIKVPNPGINYGYALQYFIFALFVIGGYCRYLLKQR